jgi:hypothetical protein
MTAFVESPFAVVAAAPAAWLTKVVVLVDLSIR